METLDNPAGRLHDVLRRLNSQDGTIPLRRAWAGVLGVPEADVPAHLGPVLQLVTDIPRTLADAGVSSFDAVIARFSAHWVRPIFPGDYAFNSPLSGVKVGAEALEPLSGISAYLHAVAPDGLVPDPDVRTRLRDRILEVIDEVRAADEGEIPTEVKRLVVKRLAQMLTAVETVAVGGPEAVRSAAEAVAGALATHERGRWRDVAHRVAAVAGVSWFIFTAPGVADNSFEPWNHLAGGALHSLVSEFAPSRVPSLPPPAQTALPSGSKNAPVDDSDR